MTNSDIVFVVSLLCALVSGYMIGAWLGRRDG
jgi:hypothetical protein